MKKSRSITSKLPAALALVVVAALWCFASEGGWVPAFMLPSPRAVVQALLSDAPVLAANAAVTLQEAAWGLLIGIVVALVLSTLMHRVRWLYRALYPILVITQTIPTIAIAPLLVLTLKVATVSLASITVFSGMDPDKLANGLMWYGCPERLSFSISYAYRMLPILMEEFQNILLSYRLRGNPPEHEHLVGKIKYLIYQIKVIIHSFYPLMLNTAKRSRTTVEVLEIKGYRYAAVNKEVKKIKLSSLCVSNNDLLFLSASFLWIAVTVLISTLI